jgi:hypothetical protein
VIVFNCAVHTHDIRHDAAKGEAMKTVVATISPTAMEDITHTDQESPAAMLDAHLNTCVEFD